MDRKRIFKTLIFGIFLSLLLSSTVWGLTPQRIAQKAFSSVVLLVMKDANGQSLTLGSGFFVGTNIIATNMHVIEGAAEGYAKIVREDKTYKISGTVGISKETDLALLLVKRQQGRFLQLGNSEKVQVGDVIYAIGSPLGLEGTFSKGMVSGVHKIAKKTLFQITTPLAPGSSGGPILNEQGEAIGISVAYQKEEQSINFAVPSYYLSPLLSNIVYLEPLPVSKYEGLSWPLGISRLKGVVVRKTLLRHHGYLEFSLYNQLRVPVKNVRILIIQYDKEGYPLDANEFLYREIIRPKLSHRLRSAVGNEEIMKKEWGDGIEKRSEVVEVRILGYIIVDDKNADVAHLKATPEIDVYGEVR
jgi:V8-like Glu-specific endopeptidase